MTNGLWKAALVAVCSFAATLSFPAVAGDEAEQKIQAGTGRVPVQFGPDRTFYLTSDTLVTQSGVSVSRDIFIQAGTGRVARFTVASDVDAGFTTGTLSTIDFGVQLKGPITSVDPLTVLNIPVVVTADTLLQDIPNQDPGSLLLLDILDVGGFQDEDSTVQATVIELKPDGVPEWKLTGFVTSVSAQNLSVGPQVVQFNGVTPRDCDTGLGVGQFVEIKAAPDESFTTGSALTTTTDIECKETNLGGDPGNNVPASIEGFITDVDLSGDFFIGDQFVDITETTVFRNGEAEDIRVGIKVEAQGNLNTDTGTLTAVKVTFKEIRVRAEAPVSPADIGVDTLRIFGFTVQVTPQTRVEDGIMSGGLTANTQVEVRAFVDSDNNLFATRIRERGNPQLDDVRLRGPIESIDRPLISILGVTIDTSSSLLRTDDAPGFISADEFFQTIHVGAQVQIEDDALYDPATNTISQGIIEIEDSNTSSSTKSLPTKGPTVFGVGIGQIEDSGDILFLNAFE